VASARGNPTLIGGFVVGAAVLMALAVIMFGSGHLFEDRLRWVAYFDHSVHGLDVGAPVIFHGVQVGQVTQISALVKSDTLQVSVPVYFEGVPERITVVGSRTPGLGGIMRFIEAGLRAQLKSQSLITGKLYVDLDVHPDSPLDLKGYDPDTPEIPTVPSTMEQLQRQASQLLRRIGELPLNDLMERLASAAAALDKLLNKPELSESIDGLEEALADTRRLLTTVNARIDGLADRAEEALAEIRDAVARAEATIASLEGTIQPGAPLQYQLMTTLEELQAAARSIRTLSDGVSRQPEQVIFGRSVEGGDQ